MTMAEKAKAVVPVPPSVRPSTARSPAPASNASAKEGRKARWKERGREDEACLWEDTLLFGFTHLKLLCCERASP